MSIIASDQMTVNAVYTADKQPTVAIQQTETPARATEVGPLVYDETTHQYKRVPDATNPAPYPVGIYDSSKIPVNPASQETLTETVTRLTSILAKLSSDPATQTTLAAILAKMIAAPATADLQTIGNTSLATIAGKDFATQTTLTAVLTKLSSDPATATLQTTGNTSLANLDIALTVLRDAILGTSYKTITDIVDTLNAVVIAAGTNIIGKVGIDQTTPGTTNGVVVKNSSGTEILTETDPGVFKIGSVGIVIPTDKQAIYRHAEIDYTTPITGSGTYTSSAIDGLTLKRVTGTVYADQAGELHFEHSKDGANWRRTRSISVVASTPQSFDEPFYSRYQRLIYANGATAQGAFELVVYSAAE